MSAPSKNPESSQVSVYVPAYNAEKYLEGCLNGIKRQTCPPAGIYVVDDGCTDSSASIAREMGAEVLKQPENLGLSMGRRRAFEEIETPYIAALDADCVPEPQWLEILMGDMTDPTTAGTSGKLLEFPSENPVDRWRGKHMIQHWGEDKIINPLHLFGNNTLFRRDAVLEAGNYPKGKEYRTNNEDYYISRRLRERGYKIVYNPASIVYHHRKDSKHTLFKTYWNWFFLHRPRPDSPKNLFRKTIDNIYWTTRFLGRDIRERDGKLALLDMQFLISQGYWDYHYFRRH